MLGTAEVLCMLSARWAERGNSFVSKWVKLTNIAMDNHRCFLGESTINDNFHQFSIVMLVYWRVICQIPSHVGKTMS